MRGVTVAVETGTAREAREFAETVAAVVARHARPDRWRPGLAVSDADSGLDRALSEAGWEDLARDASLLPFAAPAAEALGRGSASLSPVDRLLGGALRMGALARYAAEGQRLVEPRGGRLYVSTADRLRPLPYTDALGVARVEAVAHAGGDTAPDQVSADEAARRMAAWAAASTGYLAGLAGKALDLALDHAHSRRAFGGTLAALEPVQQMLADAATLADGLRLLTEDRPALDALAHAGEAAERVTAACMQVTGAVGFTLEFPLQRAYRRSRAARSWSDAVLVAWEEPPR
jgi:3-oxo-4-pregnene-20-carboxyl-CoA dehydrogenase alpha subunit